MRKISGPSFQTSSLDTPQVFLTRPTTPTPPPSVISSSNSSTNLHILGNISSSSTNSNNSNNNSLQPTPTSNRRKFSFPVTSHSALLLGENNTISARRRLSNVSDVVTRKLSSTIGWKNAPVPTQEIVTQGKCLCSQYIRYRLKRAGILNRKIGVQRLRSFLGAPTVSVVRDVFNALNLMGEELERMHPRVYTNVARQLSREVGGELSTDESAPVLLNTVSRFLFKNDITWSKVISLFAITGGLAVDCVRQGHPEYLPKLIDGIGDVIEDELAPWINENGGWTGLNVHVKADVLCEIKLIEYVIILGGCTIGLIIVIFLFKMIGYHLIPCFYKT